MLVLLLLLIGAAWAHVPRRGERVTVCAVDAHRRFETATMDGAAAVDYVRMMPGTCWGACPCPARETAACALGLLRDDGGAVTLLALTNSTTVVETRIVLHRADGPAEFDARAVPLEPSDRRATLEVRDVRFGLCRAERDLSLPAGGPCTHENVLTWDGASCPDGRGVVRCLGARLQCVVPPAPRAVPCAADERLGRACTRTAGACVEEGVYVCANGRVVCDAREPIPETCASLRYACGVYMTACGETIDCGSCLPGQRCYEGHCFS